MAGKLNNFFASLAYGTLLDRPWSENSFPCASSLRDTSEYFRRHEIVTFAIHLQLLMISLIIFCERKITLRFDCQSFLELVTTWSRIWLVLNYNSSKVLRQKGKLQNKLEFSHSTQKLRVKMKTYSVNLEWKWNWKRIDFAIKFAISLENTIKVKINCK